MLSRRVGKLLAERVAGAPTEDHSSGRRRHREDPLHGWRATGIALAIGWKRLQDRLNP